VLHAPFLSVLVKASQFLQEEPQERNKYQTERIDLNLEKSILRLNISHMDLPNLEDQEVISIYEQEIAKHFNTTEEITFKNMMVFLSKYPRMAEYGLPGDFGSILFNLMMTQPDMLK
jgi:hypothetical protein